MGAILLIMEFLLKISPVCLFHYLVECENHPEAAHALRDVTAIMNGLWRLLPTAKYFTFCFFTLAYVGGGDVALVSR